MYKYRVTAFQAHVLDKDKNKAEKIRTQLEETLAEHANDGWEFVGQYDFTYDVEQTGCFGGATGKKAQETQNIKQLVFRMQI
tara:strand:+ start:638 stop:883 length:246 start_codon:yes stop_codon:yes gene_type:complete